MSTVTQILQVINPAQLDVQDLKKLSDAIVEEATSSIPESSGWATTGTTTLTGNTIIDIDGNTLEFSGGEVGIGGAAVGGFAITTSGDVQLNSEGSNNYFTIHSTPNKIVAQAYIVQLGDGEGFQNNTNILILDGNSDKSIAFTAVKGIQADAAIFPYANNAAAVAAIGTGKLYYTDVAGEYIVKMSH